jgi:hypothetical protein
MTSGSPLSRLELGSLQISRILDCRALRDVPEEGLPSRVKSLLWRCQAGAAEGGGLLYRFQSPVSVSSANTRQ